MGPNDHTKLRVAVIAKGDLGHVSNRHTTWGQFKKRLATPLRDPHMKMVQYQAMSLDKQQEAKDVGSYVLGHFEGGKRKKENIHFRSAIALDLDNPSFEQMDEIRLGLSEICRWDFACVTTRSHTLMKAKYRLIFPSKKPIPAEHYFAVSRILTSKIFSTVQESMAATDDVSHRVAQVMFFSSCNSDAPFEFFENAGEVLDHEALLEEFGEGWNDYAQLPADENRPTRRPGQLAPAERPNEKQGPVGDFCRAYSVQAAIEKFLPDVYIKEGRDRDGMRYTYAQGSGYKGVVVYDDGQFIYSHHGTDPCSERNTNAFDMVRLHKFGSLDKVDGDPDSPGKTPSFKAMVAWAASDPLFIREKRRAEDARIDAALPTLDDDGDVTDRDVAPRESREPRPAPVSLGDDLDELLGTPPIEDDEDAADEEAIPDYVARINRDHALVMLGGKAYIAFEQKDGRVDFGKTEDLHIKHANQLISNGKGGEEPISVAWIRHRKRRQYLEGVKFDPDYEGFGALNMWKGFGVEPKKGDCSLILKHIREVLCPDSERDANYLIGWLAHMFQFPSDKPGVSITIKGRKGVGKDTLGYYIKRMCERNYRMFADSSALYGSHNQHLEQCFFCHLEEAIWVGNPRHDPILKSMITGETMHINPKGVNAYSVKSILRLFMSTNEKWAVPATNDERRYFVTQASEKYRFNRNYFNPLRAEMLGDGPAAFLDYLLNYDISNFEVRDVPETQALAEQKAMGHKNLQLFWREVLDEGEIPSFDNPMEETEQSDWHTSAVTLPVDRLYAQYRVWMKDRRYDGAILDKRTVGKELKEMVPGLERKQIRTKGTKDRGWFYVIPSLLDCRAAFDHSTGSLSVWEEHPESELGIDEVDPNDALS